jgi:Tol biopolymer transport system component
MKPKEVLRMNILAPEGTNYDMLYGGQFALSPDGSMLAFVATDTTRGAVSKLWVRKLSSLEALPLPGTDKAYWPFWSPDSKYIAFFAEQKLKKILASGAPPLSICDSIRTARGGSWGRKDIILFTPNWEGPLYKVSAAGGIATVASRLDSTYKDFTHRWVDFLPDGEHFIFYSRTEGNVGGERDAICVGSLNSPEIKRLFAAKSSASYDDGHILFVRDGVLMAQPFDPNSLDLNGDAVPTAERVTSIKAFSRSAFSVAPSGRIVYQNWETQSGSKLLIIDREGRVLDSIGEIADQFHLRLSPDEKYLAIQMNDPNANNTDIWIVDLVRRIQSRFTFDAGYDLAPVWSPDGSQIAYYSQYNKHMGIYIKATTSADTGRLVFESDLSLWIECWSNDGKYLVFQQSTNTDADDIWILPLEIDSKPFKFLATKYQENDAQISPDGRWMAYFSDESGKGQVYVSPFPKPTAKWQVSVREGSRPMWSKDGKQVYYIDNEDHVMVAQVDGAGSMFQVGKVERLFEVRQFRPVNDYDVFSDNKRFVVNTPMSDKTNSTLIFVQNWAEELKK